MKVIHQDLGTIKGLSVFYDTIIPTVLQLIMTAVVMVVTVLFIHPITVLIPLISIVAIGAGMGMLQGLGNKKNNSYIKSFNQMGQRFLGDFKGMNTLIMYQREDQYAKDFADDSENYRQKTMGVLSYQLQTLTIMDFCLYGALGWFVLAQGFAIKAGSLGVPSAVLISTLVCIWLIDFRKFGYFIHIFMSLLPKVNHIFKLIDVQNKTVDDDNGVNSIQDVKNIQLTGTLAFDEHVILQNGSLNLTQGKLIGLTGASGSGKSTVAKLLMKQLNIPDTQITVDGHKLDSLSQDQWWKMIGYLGPEMVLFDGTIEDNFLLGMHDQTDWQQKLNQLQLCQFVEDLPEQFNTIVGEDGSLLSPGQKQQIAVARAILANKPAYIFDEVTSNIDTVNAEVILAAIKSLATDKAVLLITHRLEDIEQLSKVYMIDNQKLVVGSPEELANQVPAFKQLITEQRKLLAEVQA